MVALTAPEHDHQPAASTLVPPQDIDAEQSVLGAMLMSKDAIADVVDVIRAGDFYRPAHEFVYDAVLDLYGRGEPADAITVAEELVKRGLIAKVGGHPYLHDLLASVSVAANAGFYARIVADKATLRRLAEASTRVAQRCYAGEGDVDQLVDQAQADMYAVTNATSSEDYLPLSVLMEPALDEIEALAARGSGLGGVPTGITDLDDLLDGLHPGQLVVVAARPGAGKSVLGMNFLRAASIAHGLTSVLFSLEMSRSDIVMRLLSAEARVPLNHIRKGEMTEDDWARVSRRMGVISQAPLFIDDSPNLTMNEIRSKARRLKQRHGLKLIAIDYLQLMSSGKKVESRQVEVSEFSRQMKLLAKEIDVPIVALSQLNRGSEQRTDKRPLLSDLRDSGAIEQDADIAILLHRDDMYDKESPRMGEADLIVAKHRNGATKTISTAFLGHESRFADLAGGWRA